MGRGLQQRDQELLEGLEALAPPAVVYFERESSLSQAQDLLCVESFAVSCPAVRGHWRKITDFKREAEESALIKLFCQDRQHLIKHSNLAIEAKLDMIKLFHTLLLNDLVNFSLYLLPIRERAHQMTAQFEHNGLWLEKFVSKLLVVHLPLADLFFTINVDDLPVFNISDSNRRGLDLVLGTSPLNHNIYIGRLRSFLFKFVATSCRFFYASTISHLLLFKLYF